jgi:EAL domain-containing protein (putative c-di-GMP-specific phosphodiesterase class I)
MITLENVQTADEVSTACDQIADGFSDRIGAGPALITISPRMGVASWPADGPDLKTVMHAAQSAMHEALQTGEVVCLNSQAVTVRNVDALDYGNELRQAMDDGQLELYYQPRVSMPGGAITCVEALLRWNHPMRGFVGLRELLHLAKSTGLIVPLGNWVLRTACEQAQQWQCIPAPRVSVNLSQQEFSRQDLADRVIENLDRTGLDAGRIDLELTEATLMRSKDGLADLEKLKGLGVGLVLDDFGTGHSSLAYLKTYPMDALKIDRSFVRCLPDNDEDAAICEVIITMAHKLGMKAVAEGVETQEQLDFLLERGCDEFQGFHICRPLPADEIENFLNQSCKTYQ